MTGPPIVITRSPTLSSPELPIETARSCPAFTWSTATLFNGSITTGVAARVRPSCRTTSTFLAPATNRPAVRTIPFWSTTKPKPLRLGGPPSSGDPGGPWNVATRTTARWAASIVASSACTAEGVRGTTLGRLRAPACRGSRAVPPPEAPVIGAPRANGTPSSESVADSSLGETPVLGTTGWGSIGVAAPGETTGSLRGGGEAWLGTGGTGGLGTGELGGLGTRNIPGVGTVSVDVSRAADARSRGRA